MKVFVKLIFIRLQTLISSTVTTTIATSTLLDYSEHLTPTGLTKCLGNVVSGPMKIVGGTEIEENSWWWLAKLHRAGSFNCGGSILSEKWVITAAHCCEHPKMNHTIVIGAHGTTDIEHMYEVKNLFQHWSYGSVNGINNDFCLLEIVEKMNLQSANAGIICLPEIGNHVAANSKNCFVGGWGRLESSGSLPDYAQSVGVTIYSQYVCESQSWYESQSWFKIDYNTEFCAGSLEGGTDSCQGDSGGPLICVVDNVPVLYGVVSWGYGCAFEGFPGIYAKVSTAINWIAAITMTGSCPTDGFFDVGQERCPDFQNCFVSAFPGIVEQGSGLTNGNNKGSSTRLKCGDDYFDGNDGRTSTFKATCGCNSSKGCRWVWKDNKVRQCLPKNQCSGLDNIVWGGFVGNRIVGRNGVHLNTRFYYQTTADGIAPDYSGGWTVFLLVNRQMTSLIGNITLSAASLEADLVGAHQERDCSSTIFQFQSTDFHGHNTFTDKNTPNMV